MRWQDAIKDKRFLIAGGAAGVLGLIVLIRKQKSGGASDDPNEGTNAGSQQFKGAFDTTGTDMASWMSQFGKSVLDAIRENQGGGQTTPPQTAPSIPVMPTPERTAPRKLPATRLPGRPIGLPVGERNRVPVPPFPRAT